MFTYDANGTPLCQEPNDGGDHFENGGEDCTQFTGGAGGVWNDLPVRRFVSTSAVRARCVSTAGLVGNSGGVADHLSITR